MLRYIVILFSLLTLVKSQFEEINFLDAPGEIVVPVSIFNSFAETSLNDVTFLGNGTSPLINSSDFDTVLSIIAPPDGYIKFPKELVNNFTTFQAINREGDQTTDCRITKRRSEGYLIKRDTINTTCTFMTVAAPSINELDTVFSSVVIGFPEENSSFYDRADENITIMTFTVVGKDIFDNDIHLAQTLELFSKVHIHEIVIFVITCLICIGGIGYGLFIAFKICLISTFEFLDDCYHSLYSCCCTGCDRENIEINTHESRNVASSVNRALQQEEEPVNVFEYMNMNRPYGISLPQAELASQCSESVIDLAETVSRVSNSIRHSQIPMAERYQGYATTL